MTIDEAIEHAKEVARTCDDSQCAAEHIQLAEWLRQARGADKAARWYTEKIRELENRSKAFETLFGEKESENAKLRELAAEAIRLMQADGPDCGLCKHYDECWTSDAMNYSPSGCVICKEAHDLGIEVTP